MNIENWRLRLSWIPELSDDKNKNENDTGVGFSSPTENGTSPSRLVEWIDFSSKSDDIESDVDCTNVLNSRLVINYRNINLQDHCSITTLCINT